MLHCFEQFHLNVHYVIFKFQKLLIYRTLKAVGKFLSIMLGLRLKIYLHNSNDGVP